MERTILCAVLLCAALSACGDRSATLNATASTSGLRGGSSEPIIAAETASNTAVAANAAAMPSGGGGGGGGRTEERGVLKQNISLAQTTASSINTAPSDRKIVRNAELSL